MAHYDLIIDTDKCFEIDPTTRSIRNESKAKTTVIQYDHNSERFTFTLPRMIEGHDMTECNKVEVHYLNGATPGVYEVDDLKISAEDENKVTCSWLISQNATQNTGALHFLIRFSCVEADGTIKYVWNTDIFKGINVTTGMFNAAAIVEQYADVLEQWKQELFGSGNTLEDAKAYTNERIGDTFIPNETIVEADNLYELDLSAEPKLVSEVALYDGGDVSYEYHEAANVLFYYEGGTSSNIRADHVKRAVVSNPQPDKLVQRIEVFNATSDYKIVEYTWFSKENASVKEYVDHSIQQAILDSWGCEV